MSTHEDLLRTHIVVDGSDRSFGLVFTLVFSIVGLLPLTGGAPIRVWALVIAGLFFAAALLLPGLLNPLNRLWLRFGLLLNRVVSPVVLGLLFYLVFTPIGFLMRMLGKDPLGMRPDPRAESYWISREPPGPDPRTMPKQF